MVSITFSALPPRHLVEHIQGSFPVHPVLLGIEAGAGLAAPRLVHTNTVLLPLLLLLLPEQRSVLSDSTDLNIKSNNTVKFQDLLFNIFIS